MKPPPENERIFQSLLPFRLRNTCGLFVAQGWAGFHQHDIDRVVKTLDAFAGAQRILHQHAAAGAKFYEIERRLAQHVPFMRAPKPRQFAEHLA